MQMLTAEEKSMFELLEKWTIERLEQDAREAEDREAKHTGKEAVPGRERESRIA